MAKVIVAMSGGVDSSLAAALLVEQGHEVQGVFMKNWSPSTLQGIADCPWEADRADAEAVCQQLNIPFRSVNFEAEYKERVLDVFLSEYAKGRTPNPDILCNSEIKFEAFLQFAESQGAEAIATGHYAKQWEGVLYRGVDAGKDQSYFLYKLREGQLQKAWFPLGEMVKADVRAEAARRNLKTATKKDSQGICFIGHLDVKKFLMANIQGKEGSTYLLPEAGDLNFGERVKRALAVGKHRGSIFYTIGERAGEAIDNGVLRAYTGDANTKPVYVVATEAKNNRLYVTLDPNDPHLSTSHIHLEGWQTTGGSTDRSILSTIDTLAKNGRLTAQARYQQVPVAVHAVEWDNERITVSTDPQRAVAPGQSLVIYEGDRVWGGGVICATDHTIQ